ncbi:MAG: hypothetical protein ABIS35_08540 [Terracoccus sp.]
MSDRVLSVIAAGEEAVTELPMPAIAYFIIAFGLFVVALAVTWSFRNTHHKVPRPTLHQEPDSAGQAVERDRSQR